MSEKDHQFLQSHLIALIEIKGFADAFGQCCFQMERIWFSLFERDASAARSWFDKCLGKSLSFQGFERGCREVLRTVEDEEIHSAWLKEIAELCGPVDACCTALAGWCGINGVQHSNRSYYRLILDGEKYSLALSTLLLAVFRDIHNRDG